MRNSTQFNPADRRLTETFGRIGRTSLSPAALQAFVERFGHWTRRSRQQAQRRAAFAALSRLDSRTLRDLGFDRSEIGSVIAELDDGPRSTRIHRF